jgi:hypothetical protein
MSESEASLTFQSDKVFLKGPKADKSYQVTFEVGEYMLEKIAPLVMVHDAVLEITVRQVGEVKAKKTKAKDNKEPDAQDDESGDEEPSASFE